MAGVTGKCWDQEQQERSLLPFLTSKLSYDIVKVLEKSVGN